MRLGIMGGTFNPVHLGHLIAAQEAMENFKIKKICFIPNKIPPHKAKEFGIADSEERFNMVELAIASNSNFFASRIELENLDISYTINTIKKMQKIYKDSSLSFICGLDSLLEYKWFRLDDMLGILENIIVVTRPGFKEKALRLKIEELSLKNANKIKICKIPDVCISSTLIRNRIKENISIKYLVPESVENYIYRKRLYH